MARGGLRQNSMPAAALSERIELAEILRRTGAEVRRRYAGDS
jgi:hypothetical protein